MSSGGLVSERREAVERALLPGDYHVHTTYSDGSGSVADCVARAVAVGLPEIGISDHFSPVQEPWEIPHARLGEYAREVRAAVGRADITVLLGLEANYAPEHEDELRAFLADRSFDYVIGGVHDIDGFEFHDPDLRADPRWDDPDALFRRYFEMTRCAAECGCFAVIAHLDWLGLWGHTPGPAVRDAIDAALDAIAVSGAALELNTDCITDPAGVMYPSDELLAAAYARGIPLVISSDAHEAEHVGRLWDEAIGKARRAGYRETLRLSDRRLVPLPEVREA
jgi:histidinol-phosphatase (PHP family)